MATETIARPEHGYCRACIIMKDIGKRMERIYRNVDPVVWDVMYDAIHQDAWDYPAWAET